MPNLRVLWTALTGLSLGSLGCRTDDLPPRTPIAGRTAESDTAAPAVPASWDEVLDSTVTVAAPDDPTVRYFRHRFGIAFAATTSGTTIRDVLHRHNATIVGGEPAIGPRGAYIVSTPEPGRTYEAVEALEAELAAEPGVFLAYTESYRGKGVMREKRSDPK
jgi:hypothetical protein